MLDKLHLYNFSNDFEFLGQCELSQSFVLKTCQRTLVLSYDCDPFENIQLKHKYESHRGENAYCFLLETICGLKSKLLGENEIVSQFKCAYKDYIEKNQRNSRLMRVLEKLFKDSKEIRSRYLIGISQKTYSSITRKILIQQHKADCVLIIGSGNLAEDLINQLKKKCPIYISARNTQRVRELCETHSLESLPWMHFDLYAKFSHIANTIGANIQLFQPDFFTKWSSNNKEHKAFIDLGSPSVVHSSLSQEDGLYRLENIFDEGAVHEKDKRSKIKKATEAIDSIVEKRSSLLKKIEIKGLQLASS